MFQTINGIDVFVVDLTAGIPELPIHSFDAPELASYAQALDAAIRQGIVTEPAKYAISVTELGGHWSIFRIHEDGASQRVIFRTLPKADYSHPCEKSACNETVPFDDEPYCFEHSPDSGSHQPGYSYAWSHV